MTGAERLQRIRDRVDMSDRVVLIARDLVTHGVRRLTQREITWLRDQLVHGRHNPISLLQPREYDALICALLGAVVSDMQPREIE